MLTLDGVGKRFGARVVLRDVALTVPAGSIALLTGPNGSGKSTLVSIAAGLCKPDAGSVRRGCQPMETAYVGHPTFVYANLSAMENLAFWERLSGGDPAKGRLVSALDRVGLGPFADMRAGAFSRGMTQRLNLARVLLRKPRLLLLDEPSTGLDAAGTDLLHKEILAARRRGAAVVWVTHSPEQDRPVADLVLELSNGTVRRAGPEETRDVTS